MINMRKAPKSTRGRGRAHARSGLKEMASFFWIGVMKKDSSKAALPPLVGLVAASGTEMPRRTRRRSVVAHRIRRCGQCDTCVCRRSASLFISNRSVARMERSEIRASIDAPLSFPDFAEPVIGPDPLAASGPLARIVSR